MTVKLLTQHRLVFLSLKGGLSESTLVKMPHFWKSNVLAHFIMVNEFYSLFLKFSGRRPKAENLRKSEYNSLALLLLFPMELL